MALSRNLGIWKMFHDWFLSCTWKRMEPRSIIEHNFFVYRVSVRTSMKKESVLRASPNLTSNCFLGRKNFSLHYHCLYRHHFKTGEGRGVRERSSLARHWCFDKRISSILHGAKRLPEIMYFLSISLFSCYGIRLRCTHAVLKIIASLQVNKVFCLVRGG